MFLATTSIAEFWKDQHKILFAGDWCFHKNQLDIIGKDIQVLPYCWDSREKLEQSFLQSTEMYHRLAPRFGEWLNTYHGEDHSTVYWETIIGIWLRYFIQQVLDRYEPLKLAQDFNDVNTLITNDLIVPKDFLDFSDLSNESDEYNFCLFSSIIKGMGTIPYKVIGLQRTNRKTKKKKVKSFKNKLKGSILRSFNKVHEPDLFVYNSYAGLKNETILAFLNFTLPGSFLSESFVIDNETSRKISDVNHDLTSEEGFDDFLFHIGKSLIPSAYLENYREIKNWAANIFPVKVKRILTSNSLIHDEGFKIWSASQREKNAKIFINQHGGQYGAAKFLTLEEHEVHISDKFLTWGWVKNDNEKVTPAFTTKNIVPRKQIVGLKKVLIASVSSPRYTKYLYSAPLSKQIMHEFDMLIDFLKKVPSKIRQETSYRLKSEYGFSEREKMSREFPEILIEKTSEISLVDSMMNSNVFICTYNATTFLESFLLDIPTLMFWNKDLRELRGEASKYYEALIEQEILIHTPEKMSLKLLEIYDNPYEWWSGAKNRKARRYFCEYFMRQSANYPKDLNLILSHKKQ